MEILSTLAYVIGIPAMAGFRFYATAFMVGACIRFEWCELPAYLSDLSFLASTPVLTVSLVLAVADFLVDKFQFFDNTWHTIQLLVHPFAMAGVMFAGAANMNPVAEMSLALLAFGTTAAAQAAQAGIRGGVSLSPEPASNVALSAVEDVGVGAGWLVFLWSPVVFGIISILALIGCMAVVYFLGGRVVRLVRKLFEKAPRPGQAI